MSAIACKYFLIRSHEPYALEILRDMQIFGNFEPVDPLLPLEKEKYQERLSDIKEQVVNYEIVIENIYENWHDLKTDQPSKMIEISEKNVGTLIARKDAVDEEIDLGLKYIEIIRQAQKRTESLKDQLELIEPFSSIDQEVFGQYELVKPILFFLPAEKDVQEIKELQGTHFEILKKDPNQIVGVVVVAMSMQEVVLAILKKLEATVLQPKETLGEVTPKKISAALEKEISKLHKEIESQRRKLVHLGKSYLQEFLAIHDILQWEYQSLESLEKVGYAYNDELMTKGLIQVEGWMDPRKAAELESRLQKIDPRIDISTLPRQKTALGRKAVFTNNPLFRPFQSVTALLGTPDPEEVDPTPFVMPFFIAFFGFALGDAGYGLIISGITLGILMFRKLDQWTRDIVLLVFYCGLSTIFFGAITASWFGVDLKEAEGAVPDVLRSMSLLGRDANTGDIRTLQDMLMFFLIASLSIGFLHQILGLILKFIAYGKNNRWAEAFYFPGSWLLFFSAVGFLMTTLVIEDYSDLKPLAWGTLIASLVFFGWGQGYKTGYSPPIRFLLGLVSILNITSYLSNTLSYSRLLALGLATGVIGSVVNIIAGMVYDAVGFMPIAILLATVVLIIGHTANLLMNMLGTFINVARLHLVEFFPRFFEAEAVALEPLSVETRYISLSPSLTGKLT